MKPRNLWTPHGVAPLSPLPWTWQFLHPSSSWTQISSPPHSLAKASVEPTPVVWPSQLSPNQSSPLISSPSLLPRDAHFPAFPKRVFLLPCVPFHSLGPANSYPFLQNPLRAESFFLFFFTPRGSQSSCSTSPCLGPTLAPSP